MNRISPQTIILIIRESLIISFSQFPQILIIRVDKPVITCYYIRVLQTPSQNRSGSIRLVRITAAGGVTDSSHPCSTNFTNFHQFSNSPPKGLTLGFLSADNEFDEEKINLLSTTE